MKRRRLLLSLMLVSTSLLLLSACSTAEASPLAGTSWVIVLEEAEGEAHSLFGPTEIHIQFSSATEGTVSGSYGWSKYVGEYVADGTALTMSDVRWTTMNCQAEGGMDAEQQYIFALMDAVAYTIDEDTLSINYGHEVLVFTMG